MSSINIIIDQHLNSSITQETRKNWFASIIKSSAKLLNKNETEIIIKLEEYQPNEIINMPDILVRAETSVSRRGLIKDWGRILLEISKSAFGEHNNIHIAVKTYVIDSEWIETNQ